MSEAYVFLDTNIYMHYQPVQDIDWPSLLDVDDVVIVIPPIVIKELNKHKDAGTNSRLRQRARTVLRSLGTFFEKDQLASIRDRVQIQLEERHSNIDYESYGLAQNVQDDHLVASILMYRNELPETDIVLVTSDTGLTLIAKAKRLDIKTLKLPEDLRIPEEPDPRDKQILELENELRELKHRIPKLSLVFPNDEDHATFEVAPPLKSGPNLVEEQLAQVRRKHLWLVKRTTDSPTESDDFGLDKFINPLQSAMNFGEIADKDIDAYHNKLETFFEDYEQYLLDDLKYRNIKRRTVRLVIELVNSGTAPAEDIDVSMQLPDDCIVISEADFSASPEPPRPPRKPSARHRTLMDIDIPSIDSLLHPSLYDDDFDLNPNISELYITHSDKDDTYHYRIQCWEAETPYVRFTRSVLRSF